MMIALARQELPRAQQAGLLARTALTVAAGRMGGWPPMPFLEGENALQAEIIDEVRRRLEIAPHDGSDEALRAIEDVLDAEMEAVAEPVDVDAALARAAALVTGTAQATDIPAGDDETGKPAAAELPEGTSSGSPPSFRLRPRMPKPPSASLFPVKAAARAEAPGRDKGRAGEPDVATKPAEVSRPFLHPPLPPQERFQEWGRLRAPVRELSRPPSLFARMTASFRRQRQERPGEPEPALATSAARAPHLPTEEERKGAAKDADEAKEPAKKTAGDVRDTAQKTTDDTKDQANKSTEDSSYDIPAFLRR
jgi:hypothetical protein